MSRLLAWAAIVILATYLILVGGSWAGIYEAPLRIISMSLATATLAVWAAVAWKRPAWRPRSVLVPAIFVSLASLAISTAFSRVPRVSLEYLGYAIVLVALYLLFVRLFADRFFGPRLLTLAGLFFAVIATAYLAQVLLHWIDWWRVLGRLAIPPLRPDFEGLTYLNPSAVLTMVALLAVPAAATIGLGTARRRVAVLAIVGVVAIVAFLTGSRAGWAAIALTAGIAGAAASLQSERRRLVAQAVRQGLASRRARVVLALAAVLMTAALAVFAPAVIRRLSEGGEDIRGQYALAALRMFAESPIVGTGPGTWVIQHLAETGPPDFYIPHAHNIEVQTLAELGIVGGLAGLVAVLLLARLVLGAIRDPDPYRRRFGWGAFLGLTYFALHQLFDFYANMPAVLFAAALPVAYLDATARPGAVIGRSALGVRLAHRIRPLGARLGAALLVLALGGLLLQEVPAMVGARAVELADSGDWAAADGPARQAAAADPDIGSYVMTAGLTAARAGDHRAAAAAFDRVARRDDLPEAWLDLAAEQVALGLPADARSSLQSAYQLGRYRPAISVGVADLALRVQARDLAVDAIVDALGSNPTIAADPWWAADSARSSALNDAVTRVQAGGSPDLRWQVAMAVGDVAHSKAAAAGSADPAFNALVIDGWAGEELALQSLEPLCYQATLDPVRLTWCARVAAHARQSRWLDDMNKLLETLLPGASDDASVLRVATPADSGRVPRGGMARFWGIFTYRRAAPYDLLVPGVVHLVQEWP